MRGHIFSNWAIIPQGENQFVVPFSRALFILSPIFIVRIFFPSRMNDLNKDGTDGDEKLPAQSYFPIVSVQHMFEFNNITIVNACLVKLTNSKHRNVSGPIYHNDICIPCQVLLIYCDICNISTVI